MDERRAEAGLAEETSCNRPPWWLARLRARFPGLSARYLELDPRSLGLVRIYIGGLLLVDLLRHLPELEVFYTNDGLLPNHAVLRAPTTDYAFSLFFTASHTREAAALFALCGLVFAGLLAGWYTRAFHIASFIAILSFHVRTVMFEDGAECTTKLLVFWTLFLPMGARFSIDALRARAADGRPAETRPAVSLACLGIAVQLAVIYFFNTLHKNGETWREGTTVHYVLHQDRIVTWLGWQLREQLTLGMSQALTWSALATEAVLPLLLLTPFKTALARRVAIVLGVGLHVGFALLLNLGLFSANMIGLFLLLIGAREWEALARLRVAGWARARVASSRALQALRAWLVYGAAASPAAPAPRGPAWLRALWTQETLIACAFVVLGRQMLWENAAVPAALKPREMSPLMRALVEYPRLFQGWSMFAPDAPKDDMHLYVDALTVDGRHVDPLNEVGSRVARVPLGAIPDWLGESDSFCDYMVGILGRPEYHEAFKAWIFRYPRRTGNPNDRITSFRVIVLQDDSPPPGETRARNVRERVLLTSAKRQLRRD